jgi:hypothetical protein
MSFPTQLEEYQYPLQDFSSQDSRTFFKTFRQERVLLYLVCECVCGNAMHAMPDYTTNHFAEVALKVTTEVCALSSRSFFFPRRRHVSNSSSPAWWLASVIFELTDRLFTTNLSSRNIVEDRDFLTWYTYMAHIAFPPSLLIMKKVVATHFMRQTLSDCSKSIYYPFSECSSRFAC